jgi:hypothetical protein
VTAAVTVDAAGRRWAAPLGTGMNCLAISCAPITERIARVRPDLSSRVVVRPHQVSVAFVSRRPDGPVCAEAAAMGLDSSGRRHSEEKNA